MDKSTGSSWFGVTVAVRTGLKKIHVPIQTIFQDPSFTCAQAEAILLAGDNAEVIFMGQALVSFKMVQITLGGQIVDQRLWITSTLQDILRLDCIAIFKIKASWQNQKPLARLSLQCRLGLFFAKKHQKFDVSNLKTLLSHAEMLSCCTPNQVFQTTSNPWIFWVKRNGRMVLGRCGTPRICPFSICFLGLVHECLCRANLNRQTGQNRWPNKSKPSWGWTRKSESVLPRWNNQHACHSYESQKSPQQSCFSCLASSGFSNSSRSNMTWML